jgi:L-rhamnose isomerase
MTARIDSAYAAAKDRYAEAGVDTDAALARLAGVPISLHCWQGDDVEGFEKFGTGLGGGLAATGNYPGKARTPDDLRSDASLALSMIPGSHRFNLHACYGEFGGKLVDRDEVGPSISPDGSTGPVARHRPRLQPDVFFASQSRRQHHPVPCDPAIRTFGSTTVACRIGAAMGKALGKPCVTNL